MSVIDDNPLKPCVICDVDVDTNDSDRMVWIGDDVSTAELSEDYEHGPAHRGCYEMDRDNEAERRGEIEAARRDGRWMDFADLQRAHARTY